MNDRALRRLTMVAGIVTLASAAFAIGAAASSTNSSTSTPPDASPSTPPDASTASLPDASADIRVSIEGFMFQPNDITVGPGASITWVNDESVTHNVFTADGLFASDDLDQGDSYTVTVDDPVTIDYYCGIHQFMRGTITVEP